MIEALLITVGITLILYGIYKRLTINDDYFVKRQFPACKPQFILGDTGKFFLRQLPANDFIWGLYNKFPDCRIFGLFDFSRPFLFVRDPDLIKQLAVKEFDSFVDHRSLLNAEKNHDLFTDSLLLMRGNKWRDMRSTLSPAFTGSKMKQMFGFVRECAIEMVNHLQDEKQKRETLECDTKDIFKRYANDVIASCAFGIKVNSFKDINNEFYTTGSRMTNFSDPFQAIKLFLIRVAPAVTQALGIHFIGKSDSHFFSSLILNAIDERNKKNIFRPDMINTVMLLKQGKSIKQSPDEINLDAGFATVQEETSNKAKVNTERTIWSDHDLIAQCFIFFAAGFDTTSTLMSFALYELALNPDIQHSLYEELVKVECDLSEKPLQYETLQELQYLDQVISETLRKWPPVMLSDRRCVKEYVLNDENDKPIFQFEKGISFWIPIYGIHRDDKHYPNAEKFDPDRFNQENRKNINPSTYLPFGIGPRNCIGSRFALMEIKAVLYSLLLKFEVMPTKNTIIPIKLAKSPLGVIPERPIILEFKLRKKIL